MRDKVVILLSIFICFISQDVFADLNSDLENGLSGCFKISKDNKRLACFDKLAQKHVAISNPVKESNESVSKIAQIKSKETKKIDNFSKQHLKKTQKEKGPDSIMATISKVSKLIRGQWVVYLENGQKWQQKDSEKIKLKVGDSVRLKKGTMGVVYLYKEGSHRSIKVKRLK